MNENYRAAACKIANHFEIKNPDVFLITGIMKIHVKCRQLLVCYLRYNKNFAASKIAEITGFSLGQIYKSFRKFEKNNRFKNEYNKIFNNECN